MRKKHNRIFLSLLLMLGLAYAKNSSAQTANTINVQFEIPKNAAANFANEVRLVLTINGQEVQPLMYINGFVVPDFKSAEKIDVCFIYKGEKYLFPGLSVSKFKANWVFGIIKKPKGKKREYYIRFNPEGGDGTQVTVTEP